MHKKFKSATTIPAFRAEGKIAEQKNIGPKKERPNKKFRINNKKKLHLFSTLYSIRVTIKEIISIIVVLKIIQAR